MNRGSGIGQEEGLIKAFDRNKRRITYCEGMESNEISLGPVENGLYFRREKKRVFLLQRT
jgi:hypothetical protein